MPRRTLTPATPTPSATVLSVPRDPSVLAQSDPTWAANLRLLRRQWKWAAFSQFFYTFAPLLAVDDVTLADVEDDLARSSVLYLPRIMQRLLYTLTQDRKISMDNWQTALRKQYFRRDPDANPIGPEPEVFSRESSVNSHMSDDEENAPKEESAPPTSVPAGADELEAQAEPSTDAKATSNGPNEDSAMQIEPAVLETLGTDDVKEEDAREPRTEAMDGTPEPPAGPQSRDWTELSMLEKLDSLHLLTEWQFQNPYRLRQLMKSDDESASWRTEPIGYDAKTNAYWLIGPDRLWIQRVPPKPPKSLKRKRTAKKPKASTSKVHAEEQFVPEPPSPRASKRTRVQPEPSTTGRSTRRKARDSAAAATILGSPTGKGARAAKLQANKKLDAQARELAEFQRQSAALSREKDRATRSSARGAGTGAAAGSSPLRRTLVGTRASARLRGPVASEEDEWQPIPDEWLREAKEEATPKSKKGKEKEVAEEEKEQEQEQEQVNGAVPVDKSGLDEDNVSELTELSELTEEQEEELAGAEAEKTEAENVKKVNGKTPRGRKTRGGGRTSSRKKEEVDIPSSDPPEPVEEAPPDDAPPILDDFVEWEAICITLQEWEHIAERFEKATHYLEKALYKMLTQHIVPVVTAELREAERKQRMEEALNQRKRSSRIALKEIEKEEARLTAKKRVEDDEKNARARRQEARMRKEEEEREKREQAREQRRIEREEREARARERAGKSANADFGAHESSMPTANGTHSTGSVQLSRVTTPSGVRTPDWMLDCEICQKSGLNVDDGLPMVSCGSCSKWQHITCHDSADRRMGRPKRNWEEGQFYCARCRQKMSGAASYNSPHVVPYAVGHQPSSWSSGAAADSMHLQKANTQHHIPYAQSIPDPRYHPSPNGSAHNAAGPPTIPYSRPPPYQAALTFAHYQPELRGFSTSRTTHRAQNASPPLPQQPQPQQGGWSNGYWADMNNRTSQITPYAAQYTNGGYASSRAAYQQSVPVPAPQQYATGHESGQIPVSNSRWTSGSPAVASYPTSSTSAVDVAADALTYMQGGAGNRNGGWSQPPTLAAAQHVQSNGDAHPDRTYAEPFTPGSSAHSPYSYQQHSPS